MMYFHLFIAICCLFPSYSLVKMAWKSDGALAIFAFAVCFSSTTSVLIRAAEAA